jgi:branched-subunit amino acid aminotransferase/4-amino-4-deoxychorismate lyase
MESVEDVAKRVPAVTAVERRAISLVELKSADEVFTMDVAHQVSSVRLAKGSALARSKDDVNGPVTAAVQLAYSSLVTDESTWEPIPTWPRKE